MTDQWAYWKRAQAREQGLQMREGTPESGFYRLRTRNQHKQTVYRAVAVWYGEDGALHALLDGREWAPEKARERWQWFGGSDISEELYRRVVEKSEPWPDLNETVTLSNNAPDDNTLEGIEAALEALIADANKVIKSGEAQDENAASRAADLATKISELRGKAEKLRKAEKDEYLEAGRKVDEKWRPILTRAEIYKNLKAIVLEPWLKKKAKEAEAAADDAKKKIAAAGLSSAEAQPTVTTTNVGVGTRKKVSLRDVKVLKIDDFDAVLAHFKNNAVLRDTVSDLAERALKSGEPVPGARLEDDKKAV